MLGDDRCVPDERLQSGAVPIREGRRAEGRGTLGGSVHACLLASGCTAQDEKRRDTPDDDAREREERLSPPRVTQAHSRSSSRKLTLTRLRVEFYARVLGSSGSPSVPHPVGSRSFARFPSPSLRTCAACVPTLGACRHLDANPTISLPLHRAPYHTSNWGTRL